MIFVFDNSPLSTLFRNFYRSRFPSLWEKVDAIVDEGRLVSTREVLNEEGLFVAQIFSIRHFQQNIEQKKLYKGGYNADPFVVAKAAIIRGTVVTMEEHAPNAAKIPNICERFDIPCLSLEKFMEAESWEF